MGQAAKELLDKPKKSVSQWLKDNVNAKMPDEDETEKRKKKNEQPSGSTARG